MDYKTLKFLLTVDNLEGVCSDWLVKLQIFFAIYLRATREKNGVPVCIRDKQIFWGVYIVRLIVLVYTKTTIHLSVAG